MGEGQLLMPLLLLPSYNMREMGLDSGDDKIESSKIKRRLITVRFTCIKLDTKFSRIDV